MVLSPIVGGGAPPPKKKNVIKGLIIPKLWNKPCLNPVGVTTVLLAPDNLNRPLIINLLKLL